MEERKTAPKGSMPEFFKKMSNMVDEATKEVKLVKSALDMA